MASDELHPRIPERGIPLFHIHQEDLVELERILPELCSAMYWPQLGDKQIAPRLRVQLNRCKEIISNVRWNYGPPCAVEQVPFEDVEDNE